MTPLDCVAAIAPVPLPPLIPCLPQATDREARRHTIPPPHSPPPHSFTPNFSVIVPRFPARAAGSIHRSPLNSFHHGVLRLSVLVSRILGIISVLLCSYFIGIAALRASDRTKNITITTSTWPALYSNSPLARSRPQRGIGFVIANPVALHRISAHLVSSRRTAALRILGAQQFLDWCAGTVASGRSGRLLGIRHDTA